LGWSAHYCWLLEWADERGIAFRIEEGDKTYACCRTEHEAVEFRMRWM
jgi:hypothetical protein